MAYSNPIDQQCSPRCVALWLLVSVTLCLPCLQAVATGVLVEMVP
eukprot:COSAG02_NODE_928_length_15853_cov_9.053574_11_plen_45_part_00